jgi:hypothetical protein
VTELTNPTDDAIPDPTTPDAPESPGDDVDEGDITPEVPAVPDEPDEAEGEAWEADKDVTPDSSADDAAVEEPAP